MDNIEPKDKMVILEDDVIGLEDQLREQLLEKEEEILAGKMGLMRIYPQLDDSTYHGPDRFLGSIDPQKFIPACFLEDSEKMNIPQNAAAADALYTLWNGRIESFRDNGQEIPIQQYEEELKRVKATYGKDPYWIIRKALQEIQIAARTNLKEKPWNNEEGREATLDELLGKVANRAGQWNISNWFG